VGYPGRMPRDTGDVDLSRDSFESIEPESIEPGSIEVAMPPPLPTPQKPPKESLLGGKYEPVRPAGEGGMASVWLGYTHGEAGFRRKVAIKRVLRHLVSDEKFEHMFVEEAHIVSELNHPNIVQIHDFGREPEGGYFIVMEWVSGLNLGNYVHAHALVGRTPPWALVSAIAIEVLRALSASHMRKNEAGTPMPVIHRDVTPANIMIGFNGCVKLTDFGLSHALNRPRTTDPGIVKGKIAYMAPELFDQKKPDPRCDIFSVGVTLWEALTAQRLFGGEGTDVDIAMRLLACKVPPLRELRPSIPPTLEAIVNKALARKPEDRYQRAKDMIDALAALLRTHDAPTDAPALADSVREASELLLEHDS
jgi:eukaryotic-like serine/threonine-protein kinase